MNTISSQNPFFETYSTLHGTVPFDKIKTGDYVPAVREGIRRQNAEIDAIIRNPEVPTFANTVLAYEKSGEMLHRVGTVFGNLLSAETNDDLQELAKEIMPMMSEHENNISLNEELFARIKAVYEQQDKETLNPEQHKLLEDIYNGFVRNGANLQGEAKEKYRALCKELSLLTLQFSENNLKETNDYKLVITDKSQLAGLPESAVEAAAETAGEKGVEGWVFTLQAPSYGPFLTYADSRDLRRELYMAYNTKCTHDNASNNLEIVKKLANVRMEIAQLLGYDNFAEYNLQERMAQNSESVYKLLDQLLEAYTPTAKQEYAEVQALARQAEGEDFVLMPWDWAYYSHKLKDRKFNIDDELLRPYFELNNVKQGVFGLATRLYGITFKKNPDIPVYHKDVDAYEVFDKDGKFLAVFYTDFHPRAGKRSGAWMTSYKEQWIDEKTGEKEKKQFTRDIPTFEQQIAAVWPKEEELKRLKAEAESLTRKIQLDIAQKQQEMQAKTADNGNGLKIENAEVVDEVVRPSKSEPLSAASGNQEEPPKEREHVVPPPESDFIRNHILLVRSATNMKAKGPKL